MAADRTVAILVREEGQLGRKRRSSAALTAFERHTLELFATGLGRGEIASLLNRAPKTISNSLTAAKEKLGARSLTEAAVMVAAEMVLTSGATS